MNKSKSLTLLFILVLMTSFTANAMAAKGPSVTAFVLHNPVMAEPALPDYTTHFANFKIVMDLLRNDYRVLWLAEKKTLPAISLSGEEPMEMELYRGDFIVPVDGYSREELAYLHSILGHALEKAKIAGITTSISAKVIPLNYPKILVSAQSWASCGWWYYDCLLDGDVPFDHIYEEGEVYIDPSEHNLIVEHGGWGIVPEEYNASLRRFVKEGGNYVGSCWGAMMSVYRESYPPAEKMDWPFCFYHKGQPGYITGEKTFMHEKWNCGSGIADAWDDATWNRFGKKRVKNVTKHDRNVLWASPLSGQGPVILRNENPDHPVMWGLPEYFENVYWNGPVMKAGKYAKVLATFRNVVEERYGFNANYPNEIYNPDEEPNTIYQVSHDWGTEEGVEIWKDILSDAGKALYVASHRPGEGKVMVFGCHPEASPSLNPYGKYDWGYYVLYKALLWATSDDETRLSIRKEAALKDMEAGPEKVKVGRGKEIDMGDIKSKAQEGMDYVKGVVRKKNLNVGYNVGWGLIYTGEILEMIKEQADYFENWYDELKRIGTPEAKELMESIESWKESTGPVFTKMLPKLKEVTPANCMEPLYDWQFNFWRIRMGPIWEQAMGGMTLKKDVGYLLYYYGVR